MHNRKVVATLILAAAVAVGACDAVTGGTGGSPIGVGGISARSKGTGYTVAPQIAFYRVAGANFVSAQGVKDTCYLAAYSEPSTSGQISAAALGAGPYIIVALGSRTDSLVRTGGALDAAYRSTLTSGIPFTPGDSMVITVPGDRAGFPASTFRGKTAEPFSMVPIGTPVAGSPINLTWTAASDLNAAMFVTFRYSAAGTTPATLNRQIACAFIDDGSGQVPATVAAEWVAAATRDYTAQRIRTILTQIYLPLSYFNIVSTFDWPTPVSP